ncbi:hypothetical protein DSO57_1013846 [Entomophthora muscae]|uniref:Uncharacterized protein n=1 Tax=Entomophthora muscae TaxID=34485 RepID=A0ACC2T5I5_9FUNG|nr:hypothetical protein DSO57_1013846 [Entomophthora muscae]
MATVNIFSVNMGAVASASTPATNTPHLQAQSTQSQTPRPALPLYLPSCAILPPRHHSSPPQ